MRSTSASVRRARRGPKRKRERSNAASVPPASIAQLRLTVLQRLDGLLGGDHLGLFPGHGTDRGEARPYVPGDDPRHIDWAVTARTAEPHVRDHIADHELELWVVLDASSSLAFGTARCDKFTLAWSAAGAFAILAARGGNRIGAVRGSADPTFVPASCGEAHLGGVLSALRPPPANGDAGDLVGAISTCRRLARRSAMVVVVSDFLGGEPWPDALALLAHGRDVVAVEVTDPRELSLPDVGLVSVVDPESGRRRLVDTARASTRARFDELAARRRRDVRDRIVGTGADHLVLGTDRDWVIDLVAFVAQRRLRLLAAGGRSR